MWKAVERLYCVFRATNPCLSLHVGWCLDAIQWQRGKGETESVVRERLRVRSFRMCETPILFLGCRKIQLELGVWGKHAQQSHGGKQIDTGKTRTQTLIQSTSQCVSMWSIRHQCWRVCSPTSNIKVGSPSQAPSGRWSSVTTVVRPSRFEPCSLQK